MAEAEMNAYATARQNFLDAVHDYQASGRVLEDKIRGHADNFNKEERSEIEKEESRKIKDSTEIFSATLTKALNIVSLGTLAREVALSGVALDAHREQHQRANAVLEEIIKRLNSENGSAQAPDQNILEILKRFNIKSEDISNISTTMLNVASDIVYLRKSVMQKFLHERVERPPDLLMDAIDKTIEDLVKSNTWDLMKRSAISIAPKFLGPLSVLIDLIVKIKNNMDALHQPVREIGPETYFLELSRTLQKQDELFVENLAALDTSLSILIEAGRVGPSRP